LTVRTDWTCAEIATLIDLPFDELVYQAATVPQHPESLPVNALVPMEAEEPLRVCKALEATE